MAIDMTRVIQAVAESVLDEKGSGSDNGKQRSEKGAKRGRSAPRAFLIGAGLFTAGRLVAGSRGRDMLENLQDRLVDYEQRHFGSDKEDEEPEAAEDEDFDDEYDEDEEPEAAEDEDFEEEPEAEEGEEPEAAEDEDFEEEDEPEPPRRRRARSGSGAGSRRGRN
jgi:hypothetical protein